jgi:hypothetical protein
MTTVQITLPVSQEELLQVVEQLDSEDLDEFASRVQALRAERRPDVLTKPEAELMKQINLGITSETWERYALLRKRKEGDTLTESEYEELLMISDEIEMANAQRIEALAKLAALRGVSIRALMKSLGITNPGYE